MPGIARVKTDAARGVILGPGAPTVFADGKTVSLIGDAVAPHGKAPHSGPVLTSNGAQTVFADGGVPSKQGTVASCGHSVSSGSPTVIVP
jgi:uncharacterized Zn-binding protein involved in type VI secretion